MKIDHATVSPVVTDDVPLLTRFALVLAKERPVTSVATAPLSI